MEINGGNNFPILKNDLILRAMRNEKVERIPVWIMRQAGRYLPEFREFRMKHAFFEICQNPELACEVTLMPIKRFSLDAAIIFSDILVIPQSLGITIEMKEGKGPVLCNPLRSPEDVLKLYWPGNPLFENIILTKVYQAITLTRHKLNGKCPLVGFSGAPWTLMAYMIEGGSSTTFVKARSWLYRYPEESSNLLKRIAELVGSYVVEQIKAGAQAIQIFESHAEVLNKSLFQKFSIPYLKIISNAVRKYTVIPPLILFAKGAHHSLAQLSNLGYDVISIDWTLDPAESRKILGSSVALQGNLDPSALFSQKEVIQNLTSDMISRFGTTGYIANLGHGIYPETPLESVSTFIQSVHTYPINL